MEGLTENLAGLGVATLRFEYPYSDKSDFVPYTDMPMDSDDVLIDTVRAALDCAAIEASGLRVYVGGHSVSAQMTFVSDARQSLPAEAVISLAFPRKGDANRTVHLNDTTLPILFIQGTQDSLGTVDEISDIAATLGDKATVKWIEGASHGFKVDAWDDGDVVMEVAQHIRDYTSV
jgi:predicted alpha/beta-hydrolase family hydrolase